MSFLRSNVNFSLLMFNTAVLPFLADAGASGAIGTYDNFTSRKLD